MAPSTSGPCNCLFFLERGKEGISRHESELAANAGVSTDTAVLELELNIAEAPAAIEISSDAAKSGTATPGLAGHCHGATWVVRLRDDDVRGRFQISIPVLEMAAILINVWVFTPSLRTSLRRV